VHAHDQSGPSAGRRAALLRFAAYLLFLGAVLAVLSATGSIPDADEVRDWADEVGALAPVAFVPLFVGLNFVITWPILAGAAGLLFGTALGTPVTLLAVIAAALTQMGVARYLAGEHVGRLLPRRVERLEQFLQRNGAVAVMQTRIVPLLPFGVVNYAGGLTRLRFRDMALGTAVGAAPKVFGYVALGGSLGDLGAPEAKIAITLLVVLAVTGVVLVRRQLTAVD
jgi:uncharacterized membrane protein YdjX (TVP38/TMEM64 family)